MSKPSNMDMKRSLFEIIRGVIRLSVMNMSRMLQQDYSLFYVI